MKTRLLLAWGILALFSGGLTAAVLVDFENQPEWSVWEPERCGGSVALVPAPEGQGTCMKVAWTSTPPKALIDLPAGAKNRPVVMKRNESDAPFRGTLKLKVYSEDPTPVRRVEVRLKDAKGESFSWGSDVVLEPKKWQVVSIALVPGKESSRRSDKPGLADAQVDLPISLASVKLVLRPGGAGGTVYLDDLEFEAGPPQ
jgi:hypothetical protein